MPSALAALVTDRREHATARPEPGRGPAGTPLPLLWWPGGSRLLPWQEVFEYVAEQLCGLG